MNEHAIQLLIDGELGPVETDRLLAYCDEQPALWRALALGLLEQREWEVAGRAFGALPWSEELGDESPSETEVASPQSMAFAVESGSDRSSSDGTERSWSVRVGWLAMAAAVSLLCTALGFQIGRWLTDGGQASRASLAGIATDMGGDATGSGSMENQNVASPSDGNASTLLAAGGEERTEPVAPRLGVDSAPTDASEVPRYYVTSPKPQGLIPPEQQREWLRRGIWVEEVPTIEEFEYEGRRYAVPQSRYDVRYVGGLAYQ